MTNIWSLDKHQNLKHVLLLLQQQLGEQSFVIQPDEAVHNETVYLTHPQAPGMRALLYTLGQREDRYGITLEYPEQPPGGVEIQTIENLMLASLVEILAVHFDVAHIEPLLHGGEPVPSRDSMR